MRSLRCIVGILVVAFPLWAADSLRTSDSLRGISEPSATGLDTTFVAGDSLGASKDAAHRWMWPLALAVGTLGGIYFLFSVRSK